MLMTISAILILALLLAVIAIKSHERNAIWPFYTKKLLSAPEQILYSRLRAALPECIVFAQVALSRILGVKKGHNFGQWFNRINRMSVDFAICALDGSVLAVIELDDSSHDRADRKIADAKKDKALASAGVRIIRWQAKRIPDDATIRQAFVSTKTPSPISTSRA